MQSVEEVEDTSSQGVRRVWASDSRVEWSSDAAGSPRLVHESSPSGSSEHGNMYGRSASPPAMLGSSGGSGYLAIHRENEMRVSSPSGGRRASSPSALGFQRRVQRPSQVGFVRSALPPPRTELFFFLGAANPHHSQFAIYSFPPPSPPSHNPGRPRSPSSTMEPRGLQYATQTSSSGSLSSFPAQQAPIFPAISPSGRSSPSQEQRSSRLPRSPSGTRFSFL